MAIDDFDQLEHLARAAREKRPGPWRAAYEPNVPPYEDVDPEGDAVWTVSATPDREGWRTDGGCPGYGLHKAVAEYMAAADPETILRLIALARGRGGPADRPD
jgi:hypothetical protein